MLKSFNHFLNLFGFNGYRLIKSLRGIPYFFKNMSLIKQQIKLNNSEFKITKLYPCLSDRFETAGSLPLHYFYQDLLVANKISSNKPTKHVDIGSRIDGFIAHVAAFREIEVFDIRKLNYQILNVKFIQADLMNENFNLTNYCDSVSCLHAIEHFGLGRYGDSIDINGHIKGLNNINKLLNKNGKFYFSTPVGDKRIEFDAHRVFSIEYLLNIFKNKYKVDSFALVDDNNVFFDNAELTKENIKNNFGCKYGCGIFEMTKL